MNTRHSGVCKGVKCFQKSSRVVCFVKFAKLNSVTVSTLVPIVVPSCEWPFCSKALTACW